MRALRVYSSEDEHDTEASYLVFLLGQLGIPVDGDLYDVPTCEHDRCDEE